MGVHLIVSEIKACGHCGQRSRQHFALSRELTGEALLDMRPSDVPDEAPADDHVQCCEHCGYCAPDLAALAPAASRALIDSREYQALLADQRWPLVTRRLTAQSLLQRTAGQWAPAAVSLAAAAWALDDAQQALMPGRAAAALREALGPFEAVAGDLAEHAAVLRGQAARDLLEAHGRRQWTQGHFVRDQVLLVDLLRRGRQFSAAQAIAHALLLTPEAELALDASHGPWLQALRLSQRLCEQGLTRAATWAEAERMGQEAGSAVDLLLEEPAEACEQWWLDEGQAAPGAGAWSPIHLLPRLRHLFVNTATGVVRQPDMAAMSLSVLPMPPNMLEGLQRKADAQGWLPGVVLAATGVACQRLMPALAEPHPELVELLRRHVAHMPQLVDWLVWALAGSHAQAWGGPLAAPFEPTVDVALDMDEHQAELVPS